MTFNFIPCDHAFSGAYDYDRQGPDVFNITENAFLYVEKAVSLHHPNWDVGYHWGVSWLPRDIWISILDSLKRVRADVEAGLRPTVLIERHVLYPDLFNRAGRLNRRSLLRFLDEFDDRVRGLIGQYPYLIIGGY